jgi:hypothetical protein
MELAEKATKCLNRTYLGSAQQGLKTASIKDGRRDLPMSAVVSRFQLFKSRSRKCYIS